MIDYRENLNKLKEDFANGRKFTLFIGAGVNSGKDVHLLWNELVKEACEYSFRRIGQNMGLNLYETDSMMSLLGIIPTDYERLLPDSMERKRAIEAIGDFCRSKDFVVGHFPVEIQVSIIKTLLGDSYIPFLQDYLYSQCNQDRIGLFFKDYELENIGLKKHDNLYSLYVVARLILLNPQVESVITYNYDNFLSYAICYLLHHFNLFFTKDEIDFLGNRFLGNGKVSGEKVDIDKLKYVTPAVDIGNENTIIDDIPNEAIRIYHVHGYIPSLEERQLSRNISIVLSIDEYFDLINDSTSWNYATQLNSIMNTDCLFIGSSLTDLSAKRMLNMALSQPLKTNRYVLDAFIPNDKDFKKRTSLEVLREVKDIYLETLGLKVIDCDEGFYKLFSELTTITSVQ